MEVGFARWQARAADAEDGLGRGTLAALERDLQAISSALNRVQAVIEHAEQRDGLIVDTVENIITVPASARRTSPKLVRCQLSDDVRSEVEELIDYSAPGAAPATLSVFDPKVFLARLARDMDILAPAGRVPCP